MESKSSSELPKIVEENNNPEEPETDIPRPGTLRRRLSSFVRFHREISRVDPNNGLPPRFTRKRSVLVLPAHRGEGSASEEDISSVPTTPIDSRKSSGLALNSIVESPTPAPSVLPPPKHSLSPIPEEQFDPWSLDFIDQKHEESFMDEVHDDIRLRMQVVIIIILGMLISFSYVRLMIMSELIPINFNMIWSIVFAVAFLFSALVASLLKKLERQTLQTLVCISIVVFASSVSYHTHATINQLRKDHANLVIRYYHPDAGMLLLLFSLGLILYASTRLKFTAITAVTCFAVVVTRWFIEHEQFMSFNESLSYTASAAVAVVGTLAFAHSNQKAIRQDFAGKQQLSLQNSKLEAEVEMLRLSNSDMKNKAAGNESPTTLTAPIEEVTELLKTIANDPLVTLSHMNSLNKVIDLLTTNRIYDAHITPQTNIDTDTMSWLKSEVRVNKDLERRSHHHRAIAKNRSRSSSITERSFSKELELILTSFSDWSFDIFSLHNLTNGYPMKRLFLTIAYQHDLINQLQLDIEKLTLLLTRIENGYRKDISYHNNVHAADVLQTLNNLISEPLLLDKLSPIEKFSIIFAAAAHDIDHPGVNNSFMVKSRSPMALLYNDQSVLENHHLAEAFRHLYDTECDVLGHLPREDQDLSRKIIVELVLATDISKHFTLVSSFNAKVSVGNLDFSRTEDMLLLLQMLIKCADVSNPSKPLPVYLQWVKRISEEFFRQGDEEKRRNLPVSAFMDRDKPRIATNQVNFIQYICMPIFKPVAEQLGRSEIVTQAQDNLDYFKAKQVEEKLAEEAQQTATPQKQ